MDAKQIMEAIDSGSKVFWHHSGYEVIKDKIGQYLIIYDRGGKHENCIGLTHRDGITLNGEAEHFYKGD